MVLDLLRAEGAGIDRNMSKPTSTKVDVDYFGASDLEPHRSDIGRLIFCDRPARLAVKIEVGRVGAVEDNGHVEPPSLDRLAAGKGEVKSVPTPMTMKLEDDRVLNVTLGIWPPAAGDQRPANVSTATQLLARAPK